MKMINKLSTGIDIVSINRIQKILNSPKRERFLKKVFSLNEINDAKSKENEAQFFSGRFAAKEAIRKATEQAKRKIIKVPLKEGRTLHHDIDGRHGAGRVVLRTTPPGTGIIAGGPMRAVFEMLGVQDVVSKSTGSANPYNMIRATIHGLLKETSPRLVAQRRGKKMSEIFLKNSSKNDSKNLNQ